MTVDVEDYFQVSAFEKHITRNDWDNLPQRVETNTHKILDIFSEYNVKATFFILGWVAERYPNLIKRMVSEGHEIASHGFAHIRVSQQTSTEFYNDVTSTKQLLEDISSVAVDGYRAASYSIGKQNVWAFEQLQKAGYRYSSSVYPIYHDLYGWPQAPRFSFYPENAKALLEIPVTTIKIMKRNLPCGGGGYFRLLPYKVSRWAIRWVNQHDKQNCIFYFHPWEIDPHQPRRPGLEFKTRFRHYCNLARMEHRLRELLSDFEWDRMDNLFLNKKIDSINNCIRVIV
jgi:polysaccharide deacetylase family protein (PEP-CTERM system associated)